MALFILLRHENSRLYKTKRKPPLLQLSPSEATTRKRTEQEQKQRTTKHRNQPKREKQKLQDRQMIEPFEPPRLVPLFPLHPIPA